MSEPVYDVNSDGTVDSRDAALLFEGVTSGQPVPSRFDFNDDGEANVVDVSWLRQRYGGSNSSGSSSSASMAGLTEMQLLAVAAAVVAAVLWGSR